VISSLDQFKLLGDSSFKPSGCHYISTQYDSSGKVLVSQYDVQTSYAVLICDLALSGTWTPLSTGTLTSRVFLDGQGHKITGLDVEVTSYTPAPEQKPLTVMPVCLASYTEDYPISRSRGRSMSPGL